MDYLYSLGLPAAICKVNEITYARYTEAIGGKLCYPGADTSALTRNRTATLRSVP